jgi:hypothetical protein
MKIQRPMRLLNPNSHELLDQNIHVERQIDTNLENI